MTTTNPTDERSTDTEQRHDTDAAATIARERLADEIDPAEFGKARDVSEALATLAAALRADDVDVATLDNACVELEFLFDALEDVSRLHGWGWEENRDEVDRIEDAEPGSGENTTDCDFTTDDRIAEILEPLEVSRDDYGSTEIVVSDAVRTHVYDEGEPPTVTIDVDALDPEALDEETGRVTLDATEAEELRRDLDTAFDARLAERTRLDRKADE